MPVPLKESPGAAATATEAHEVQTGLQDSAKAPSAQPAASPLAWLGGIAAALIETRGRSHDLRPLDLVLAVWMAERLDAGMTLAVTSKAAAEAQGRHPQSIRAAIYRLQALGFLRVVGGAPREGKTGRKANVYRATVPAREGGAA